MSVIDGYLANVSEPQKSELQRVRKIIKKTIPDAEEAISYGMPAFKYRNKYLIAFAPFKDHMSIFPGTGAIEAIREKLSKYKLSKGTVQFTVENHLPDSLIKELVNIRAVDISKKLK